MVQDFFTRNAQTPAFAKLMTGKNIVAKKQS